MAGYYWPAAAVANRTAGSADPAGDGQPRTAGVEPPVYVFGHGFTGSVRRTKVNRIAGRLVERGATVLAVDFRGHGQSGGRSTLGLDEVNDVAAAVSWLRTQGYRRVVTLGFSMGGSVVLRHAGLGGDTDVVVSVSAPSRWYVRDTVAMRRVHWLLETRTGRAFTHLALGTKLAHDWDALPASPLELIGSIAPTPLLLVHGKHDQYFPVADGQALHAASPGSEFWLEDDMAHAESGTELSVVDRIDDWVRATLARLDSGSATMDA